MKCPKCNFLIKERTTKQNSTYYKFIVMPLADELGYTKDEMHGVYKDQVLGFDDVKTGFRIVPSTTKMSSKEFCDYIEACILIAAEQGVRLQMPSDIDSIEWN